MRLGKVLSSMTLPELEELKQKINLTDDEKLVFEELSKGRSNLMVAEKCGIATSTVSNRTKSILNKCIRTEGW